jgi:HEPN domain-containing protein
MRSARMAKDYAERATWVLKEAEQAFGAANYAISVRRSQEALELSAKAALRRLGVEYPHEHDVSEALDAVASRLPDDLRKRLDEIKELLAELARVRGPALYGYEVEGIPASEAFTTEYAMQILDRVKLIVDLFARFASG